MTNLGLAQEKLKVQVRSPRWICEISELRPPHRKQAQAPPLSLWLPCQILFLEFDRRRSPRFEQKQAEKSDPFARRGLLKIIESGTGSRDHECCTRLGNPQQGVIVTSVA